MRYFVTFEDATVSSPTSSLLPATNSRGVPRQPASFGEQRRMGGPPSRAMNFEWPGPQRLLIEPQILAISKGIWKALSTGGEMKCTRDKHTIVAFPSRCAFSSFDESKWARVSLLAYLFVHLQATWFSDCSKFFVLLVYCIFDYVHYIQIVSVKLIKKLIK